MSIILQQKCQEFINQVLEFFSATKIRAMEEMETDLKKLTDTFILDMVLCQEKVQIKMSKLFLNISMYHKLVQIIAAFAFILFYPTSFAAFCKYCVSYWLGDL